jgi:hypothetical protein
LVQGFLKSNCRHFTLCKIANMKKYFRSFLLFICCTVLFTACNTTTPERYFDIAVLNSNMFTGFADDGLLRQFESPSAKMAENGEAVAMKRAEVAEQNIQFTEEAFEKLKGLEETAETKEMLQTSVAMFEYVLPVYKNEYKQLAKLYDEGASKEKTAAFAKAIEEKYFTRFKAIYNKLISIGKAYAEKNNIKVNWNV